MRLVVEGEQCRLTMSDNGVGFDPSEAGGGLGLTNLRRRAEKLNGSFFIEGRERRYVSGLEGTHRP